MPFTVKCLPNRCPPKWIQYQLKKKKVFPDSHTSLISNNIIGKIVDGDGD